MMPFSGPALKKPKAFKIPDSCPNHAFACWLNEWYLEAAARQSRLQFAYKRALESMLKWPERLRSGRDAAKLPGIGPSIAARLQERSAKEGTGVAVDEENIEILALHSSDAEVEAEEAPKSIKKYFKKKKEPSQQQKTFQKKKEYIPALRSAPYAVLIALLLNAQTGPLTKSDLQGRAQVFSSASLTDGMFPVINGALKTLETKALIRRVGGNAFGLTECGALLALKLWRSGERRSDEQDIQLEDLKCLVSVDEDTEISASTSMKRENLVDFTWPAGSFDIICLVDVREIRSRDDRCYLSDRLTQMGVPNEVRNLELGDFLWIAKRKDTGLGDDESSTMSRFFNTEELVLPIIIERKREDDLCASIQDGRFKEQKHRLRSCLLPQPIYLVERPLGTSNTTNSAALDGERLLSASLQCQIGDGLQYRQTGSLEESIVFIAATHRRLCQRYAKQPLRGSFISAQNFDYSTFRSDFGALNSTSHLPLHVSYTAFNLLNAKTGNQTLTDILCKQLLTIKGVTFAKARHLLSTPNFNSPRAISRFYGSMMTAAQAQDALKDEMEGGKKFGVALSRRIHEVFGQ